MRQDVVQNSDVVEIVVRAYFTACAALKLGQNANGFLCNLLIKYYELKTQALVCRFENNAAEAQMKLEWHSEQP